MPRRIAIRKVEQTVWEVFEANRPKLVPYAGRFDGFHAVPASVSKTCLVRFDNNKYSVAASAVGRPVEVQAYADRIVIRQDGRIVAEHARSFGRGETTYDPWHYVPVLARKPGALRNGAPFKDWVLPAAIDDVPPNTFEVTLSSAGVLFGRLLQESRVLVGDARPPEKNGVYAFSIDGEIIYVGEASGSSGLRDRICRKHVSGDDGHALQKEFQKWFPDRLQRRAFIKETISVQWVEIPDSLMVTLVEKLAIACLKPRLNDSVKRRTIR
jgi:hypothetical protein